MTKADKEWKIPRAGMVNYVVKQRFGWRSDPSYPTDILIQMEYFIYGGDLLSIIPCHGLHIQKNHTLGWKNVTKPVLVVVSEWDIGFDRERFFDPLKGLKYGIHTNPTFITKSAQVNQDEFASHLNAGKRLPISVIGVNFPLGLDGVSYGLNLANGFGEVSLRWWMKGPEEWHPFTKWVEGFITYLTDVVENYNPM
jgi:hypothetical protein